METNQSTIRFMHLLAQQLAEIAQPQPEDAVLHVVADRHGAVWLDALESTLIGKWILSEQIPGSRTQRSDDRTTAGWTTLQRQVAQLPLLPFKDATFDIVLYSASLAGLAAPLTGLHEWHRILTPGGTLAFCIYREAAFPPLATLLEACCHRYGVTPSTLVHRLTRQPSIALETVGEYLRNANFAACDVRSEQLRYALANPEEWWQLLFYSDVQADLAQLTPETAARCKHEHLTAVTELATAQGLWMQVAAIFAVGQKK